MPLNKILLKEKIKQAFDFESDKDVDPAEARDRQAEKIANAIFDFVKGGDVATILSGTSATGGIITGTGTGKLN